jgi:hypothetical protein
MRIARRLLGGAALLCFLAGGNALLASEAVIPYGKVRRVIRCGMMGLLKGSTSPGEPAGTIETLSPYVFYVLGSDQVSVPALPPPPAQFPFSPPKPVGWEFTNPAANPAASKSTENYWTAGLTLPGMDEVSLKNFDLILLCVRPGLTLDQFQQRLLASWVEQGGLLWIDNQSQDQDEGASLNLWMEPAPLTFRAMGGSPATKFAADANHGLLKGIYTLTQQDINLLGVQQDYSGDFSGTSNLFGMSSGVGAGNLSTGMPQTLLQEVVRESDGTTTLPSISAGRFGRGAVVATSCGVAQAISRWYASLNPEVGVQAALTELPEWALPDMKLAYNMIAWAQTWSNQQGDARGQGAQAGDLGAPLSERWRFHRFPTGESVLSPLSAAVVSGGLILAADGNGLLHAFDMRPERDLDGDGRPDDGLPDFINGTTFDEVWSTMLRPGETTGMVLQPAGAAAATVCDAEPFTDTNSNGSWDVGEAYTDLNGNGKWDPCGPRSVVAVAAHAESQAGADGYLLAYRADAASSSAGSLLWSAWITDPAVASAGGVRSGPVFVDGMFVLATTDSTDNPEVPARDAYILAYDMFNPPPPAVAAPRIAIPLSAGGTGMEIFSPPSVAFLPVRDAPTGEVELVETAILVGNALPRIGASATARVLAVPLMLRFASPAWDQDWGAVQVKIPDPADPQNWESGVTVPPDEGPGTPLNYVRRSRAGQIEIFFSRWSRFSQGRSTLAPGFGGFLVRYRDTTGGNRTQTVQPQPSATTPINAVIRPGLTHSPCVVGDTVYVGGSSVEAYPNRSIPGNLWAGRLDLEEGFRVAWQFYGDLTGGPLKQAGLEFHSNLSVAPAVSSDTLYVAANYEFSMNSNTLETASIQGGAAGVVYALDLKTPGALLIGGDPVLPGGLAPQAPIDKSADPNQTVQAGTRGAVIWITHNLTLDNAEDAVPQRTGVVSNWTADFLNGIIRLGPGGLGKYGGQLLRVRYFPIGATQASEVFMRAEPLAKWSFCLADIDPRIPAPTSNWRIASAPVLSNGTVHVVVYGPAATYICSFPELSTGQVPPNPVWTPVNFQYPEPAATLAVDGDLLFASVSAPQGLGGALVAFSNPATLIADSTRLVEVKSENDATSLSPLSYFFHQSFAAGVGATRQLLRKRPDEAYAPLSLSGGPDVLGTFVTEPGKPNALSIRPGTWRFVFTAEAPSGGQIWVNLYARDQAGATYPLWTPEWDINAPPGVPLPGVPLPPTRQEVVLDVPLPGFAFDAADRILVQVWSRAANTATLYLDSAASTHMETPVAGPANSARMNWVAASAVEYHPDGNTASVLAMPPSDVPRKNVSYADRQSKGFSHPSRARKVADGNVLVCDTGNNRVVEIDRTAQVVWQYPDSDLANASVPLEYRTATAEGQRLLAPMDAQRYRYVTYPDPATRIEWDTTLIADTGHNRLVQVARPLVNGLYQPDVVLDSGVQAKQTVSIVGPDLGISRPYYFTLDAGGNKLLDPSSAGADNQITGQANPGAPTEIARFITPAGQPGVAGVPPGVWAFWFTANSAGPTWLSAEVWRADSAGNETGMIVQTAPGPLLRPEAQTIILTAAQSRPVSLDANDRLLVKILATAEAGASDVTIYVGPSYQSRAYVPFGQVGVPLMITCADRGVELVGPGDIISVGPETPISVGPVSTVVMAGLASHPADPTPDLWNIASGGDGKIRIVNIAVGLDAATGTWAGAVLARPDGINLFKARDTVPTDFIHVRQVERVVYTHWPGVPPTPPIKEERVLVVDDAGVKYFNGATWNGSLAPYFEMRPGAVADLNSYALEMAAARGVYADLDAQGFDWATQIGFFPASAQVLPNGNLLIVNCQAVPLVSGGEPTSLMVPFKSEVIEVDTQAAPGGRILRGDGSYFIVPDPFSLAYPGIEGSRSGLSQPLWVSR